MSFLNRFSKKLPAGVLIGTAVGAVLLVVLVVSIFYVGLSKNSGVVFEEIPGFYENAVFLDTEFLDHPLKFERTIYNGSQVRVDIGRTVFNNLFRLNLKGARKYSISYYQNGDFKASQIVDVGSDDFQVKEYGYLIEVPAAAVVSGYDELVITPHFEFDLKLSLEKKDVVDVSMGQEEVNLAEFIKKMPAEFYILVAVQDEGSNALRHKTEQQFAEMGSEMRQLGHRGSYAGIFHDGKVLAEKVSNSGPVSVNGREVEGLKEVLGRTNKTLSVGSAGYEAGNYSRLIVDGEDFSPDKRGHNIAILDSNLELVEALAVDTFHTDRLTHYDTYRLFARQYKNMSLGEVMSELPAEYPVLVATKGDYARNVSEKTKAYFAEAGSKIFTAEGGQSYVGVLRGHEVLAEKVGKGRQVLSGFDVPGFAEELLESDKQVTLFSSVDKQPASFFIDGERLSYDSPGINVIVLGEQFKALMRYAFNTESGDQKNIVTVLKSAQPPSPRVVQTDTSDSHPKKMRILFDEDTYQKLFTLRDKALAIRGIKDTHKKEYTAEVEFQGKTYDTDIRFKGDWVDHLEKKRWSFRFNLQGGETIMGMERFSLQTPVTRSGLFEWVVHQVFRDEGGIAPRYDFVPVDVNNKRLGTYALEEHFSKRMLEYHDRKEGPILKYVESRPFNSPDVVTDVLPDGIPFENQWRTIENTQVDVFQGNTTRETESLRNHYRRAVALLDGFRNKELKPGEVFDVDAYGKLMAVSDLFQTWHSVRWHNLRFYYNPMNDRLEPILYDADGPDRNYETLLPLYPRDEIARYMFKDDEFLAAYFRNLERFADLDYLDNFKQRYNDRLVDYQKLLGENERDYHMPWGMFQRRQEVIRNTLYGGNPLRVTVEDVGDNRLRIAVSNKFQLPYEVGELQLGNNSYPNESDDRLIRDSEKNRSFTYAIEKSEYAGAPAHQIVLNFRVPGTENWRTVSVFPFKEPVRDFVRADFVRDRMNIDRYGFLSKDEDKKVVHVQPGNWTVQSDIRIAGGDQMIIRPGTTLDLQNGARIISFSPINAVGTEDEPITITSGDRSSQGIVVLETNEHEAAGSRRSILKHVVFTDLKNPDEKGWVLPGSVSFYKSDVVVDQCVFKDNLSEDALNIVSSNYTVSSSVFRDTFADAFDADLSEGIVANSEFYNVGQDAVEFSGGEATVTAVTVHNAGGTGINAVDAGTIKLQNVTIDGADIGIVSRDKSSVTGTAVSVEQARIGLAAYQKKSEYGAASITLIESYLNRSLSLPFVSDAGSEIEVNGERLRMQRKKRGLLLDSISNPRDDAN